jgi:hypothetical protein
MGKMADAGARQQVKTAEKDFHKEIRAALLKRGITFIGTTWLPDSKGNYANGSRGYILLDNGTQRIRDYAGVISLAGF